MKNDKWLAIIKATLAVTFWGITFVATKIALQYVSPPTIVWLRFGIGLLLLGMVAVFRKRLERPKLRDIGYFAVLGFIGITLHQLLQSTGLVTSHAATTAWIVATTPIFMAILGWVVLREHVYPLQILGIICAALGVLLVISGGKFAQLALGQFGAPGDVLILISAPNWAVFSTLSRRGLQKFAATSMIFYVVFFGWVFSNPILLLGPGISQVVNLAWDGWLAIAFLGICGSGLAYIFWYDALQVMPVAQTGAFLYLEPFVTVIVAAFLLDEQIGWVSILGGVGILAGVWLVTSMQRKKNQIKNVAV